jgi:hypothetical protein
MGQVARHLANIAAVRILLVRFSFPFSLLLNAFISWLSTAKEMSDTLAALARLRRKWVRIAAK